MAVKSRRLQDLSIRNIGVIDHAQISFGPGLNVITGETGAGKTMILTGLGLLSGMRSDVDLIRKGCERLSVTLTALLDEKADGMLATLLQEHSPEIEDQTLLLQRTISRDGRSKAIVGSDLTTVSVQTSFTSELFTIHGQGINHRVADRSYQLELLDRTSETVLEARARYRTALTDWKEKSRELTNFLLALEQREERIQSLKRFITDLDRIRMSLGEWVDLEERIRRLDSVEDLRTSLTVALRALSEDDHGSVVRTAEALRALEAYRTPDSKIRELAARMRGSQIELGEIASELAAELTALEIEPSSLDELRERRAVLRQFLQRHRDLASDGLKEGEILDELVEGAVEKRRLLSALEGDDDSLAMLKDEVSKLEESLRDYAHALTAQRQIAALSLADKVLFELAGLGLDQAQFQINLTASKDYSITGSDDVEFLFSSHPGGKLLPLHKGASGGELSRVMLAVELVLAGYRDLATLIFDEIDAGIGGETGLIIGERLARLAKSFQVIVITHLAQVAVWADRHFRIEKMSEDDGSIASVDEVKGRERVTEIARMLSGQSDLIAAQKHAEELLKHAGN